MSGGTTEERLSTGNPQMDIILQGGFPANSINIIMGEPGTGKTIFAEQLVFHHASNDGRPILYLTTLSEPVAKVLTYLQQFSFYDEEKIGTAVHYRDVGAELAQDGIGVLIPILKEAIHELAPKIIFVDSFKALHDVADSPRELRQVLYQMTGMLTSYKTTVFLVGEYSSEHPKTLPEFAVADGIVQFLRNPQSTRDERFVRVLKMRGSGYSEGLHGCQITASGVEFYPRLKSPSLPENYMRKKELTKSGVAGLDEILGGGLKRGSTTLLAGPTGSGKTTFGLQFILEGIREKQRCLYVNFQENPTQLADSITELGFDLAESEAAGLFFIYESPVELQIDSIIVKIFRLIEENKIDRVVIDAMGDLELASADIDRVHDYIYSLTQHLTVRNVTSVVIHETAGNVLGTDGKGNTRFSNMSDNIILLLPATEPSYSRSIMCIKARGCDHDLKPHAFTITQKGINCLPLEQTSN
ncbi:circadian clock protein KaiC [soil metagenome]